MHGERSIPAEKRHTCWAPDCADRYRAEQVTGGAIPVSFSSRVTVHFLEARTSQRRDRHCLSVLAKDPNMDFFRLLHTGVPLGIGDPIPPCKVLFPPDPQAEPNYATSAL